MTKADDRTILHVLNRLGFGPRPGDVDRLRASGVEAYIDRQLHPESIADAALKPRLAGLATLGASSRDIARRYEQPLLDERRQKRADGNGAAGAPPADMPKAPDLLQQEADLPLVELGEQKILRAIYSERQLAEVLADFWFNHFNVDARKGVCRFLLTEYERDTIRPHVLGRFRDLLGATAKSPAMLFYLDNWMSADQTGRIPTLARIRASCADRSAARWLLWRRQAQNPKRPTGLNENYGRELMELHTLGVDGGYTQKDVTEVARCFTGWTIEQPRQGGGFRFGPRLHDEGEKTVLGHRITAGGGERDGEQVLDLLASHPSTAKLIATKLARRFVADAPPAALVDRVAARFRQTGGDLRETMRALLTSPEFLGPEAYRAKVKTPFEFVVSAARAAGAEVSNARPLVRAVQQLGMPLYQCQPPTGYKDTADAWVNTGALVNRMNFALALASGALPGSSIADSRSSVESQTSDYLAFTRATLVETMLGNDASEATMSTIARATTMPQMVALTLGAPEFQRR